MPTSIDIVVDNAFGHGLRNKEPRKTSIASRRRSLARRRWASSVDQQQQPKPPHNLDSCSPPCPRRRASYERDPLSTSHNCNFRKQSRASKLEPVAAAMPKHPSSGGGPFSQEALLSKSSIIRPDPGRALPACPKRRESLECDMELPSYSLALLAIQQKYSASRRNVCISPTMQSRRYSQELLTIATF
jgi:hypothetical protein